MKPRTTWMLVCLLWGMSPLAAQQTTSTEPAASTEPATPVATIAATPGLSAAAPAATPTAVKPPPAAKAGPRGATITGSWRGRGEWWDWFNASGAADSNYAFFASLLRLSLSQQQRTLDWQLEMSQPTLIGLPRHAVGPAPQGPSGLGALYYTSSRGRVFHAFLKQAFVRFKNVGHNPYNSLKIGRFEFFDGLEAMPKDPTIALLKREQISQRLIGNFGFAHGQRSFDGIHFSHEAPKVNVSAFSGRVTEGLFQLDGLEGAGRVVTTYAAVTLPKANKQVASEMRLFALHYSDARPVTKVDNRPLAVRVADHDNLSIIMLGGHYLRAIKTGGGTIDALIWGGPQFGQWGNQSHNAYSFAAETGYQFKTGWKPWARIGYNRSSGDNDPTDLRHETFFQFLPTARLYSRFPFYNMLNNEDAYAQLRVFPNKRLYVRADAHLLQLTEPNDLWYAGGGAFLKGNFGWLGRPGGSKQLANFYDLDFGYTMSKNNSATLYLSYADGKGVIRRVYPRRENGALVYLEFVHKF